MRSLSHIWNGWPEIGHTLTLVLNVQLFTKRRECKSRCNFVGAGGFDIGRAHFLAKSPQFSWILMLYIRSGEVQFQNKPWNYHAWNIWNLVSSEPGQLDGWHTSLLNHLNPLILRLVIQIQSQKKVGSKYIVWLVSSQADGGGGKRNCLAWRIISTPELCRVTKRWKLQIPSTRRGSSLLSCFRIPFKASSVWGKGSWLVVETHFLLPRWAESASQAREKTPNPGMDRGRIMPPIPQMNGGERHDVFLFYNVTARTCGHLWHNDYFQKHHHPNAAAWKKYFHFLIFHNMMKHIFLANCEASDAWTWMKQFND